MAKSVVYTATYTGKDPTMVRCHPLQDKVQVKKGESVEVTEQVAVRLRREEGWEVSDEVQVKEMKWLDGQDESAGSNEPSEEEKKAERMKAIKKMPMKELDEYIAAHPSIPSDLKNNDEKRDAIVGFEFEGKYPASDEGNTETGDGEGEGSGEGGADTGNGEGEGDKQ